MNTMMALQNILLIHIILVLVLVGLVRKENSAFGHVHNKDAQIIVMFIQENVKNVLMDIILMKVHV